MGHRRIGIQLYDEVEECIKDSDLFKICKGKVGPTIEAILLERFRYELQVKEQQKKDKETII